MAGAYLNSVGNWWEACAVKGEQGFSRYRRGDWGDSTSLQNHWGLSAPCVPRSRKRQTGYGMLRTPEANQGRRVLVNASNQPCHLRPKSNPSLPPTDARTIRGHIGHVFSMLRPNAFQAKGQEARSGRLNAAIFARFPPSRASVSTALPARMALAP